MKLSNARGRNRRPEESQTGDGRTRTAFGTEETAMRYLCLIYADEARLNAMPQAEVDALIDETMANNEELLASGQLILAQALDQVDQAMTVRVRDGRLSATDGPFAETNEQLGGFLLIEARDLNEAVRIAGRIPSARIGSVEVRPVIDLRRERSAP
jgi:hypothetical protein